MRLRYFDAKFEVKQLTASGEFSGYASVFDVVDKQKDIVEPGAFDETLKEHKREGTNPALLWQHDPKQPIGSYKHFAEDDRGLFAKGQLLLTMQRGREAYDLLKMDPPALNGMSIGFMIPDGGSKIDRRKGVRRIKQVDLWEVSLVTFPANQRALVETVKSRIEEGDEITPRDLELLLRDIGFSHTQAKDIAKNGYEGLWSRDADHSDDSTRDVVDVRDALPVLESLRSIYNDG